MGSKLWEGGIEKLELQCRNRHRKIHVGMAANITRRHGGHNAGIISHFNTGTGPLFQHRMALGMTRQQLSEASGVPVNTIRDSEKAGRWPRSTVAQKALQAVKKK